MTVFSGFFSFEMPNKNQMLLFKNAFRVLDKDKDGYISESDLAEILISLGRSQSTAKLEAQSLLPSDRMSESAFIGMMVSKFADMSIEYEDIASSFRVIEKEYLQKKEKESPIKFLESTLCTMGNPLSLAQVTMNEGYI